MRLLCLRFTNTVDGRLTYGVVDHPLDRDQNAKTSCHDGRRNVLENGLTLAVINLDDKSMATRVIPL